MHPCNAKTEYELMKMIREYSIAYCTFVEVRGSGLGDYCKELLNKIIACSFKIKSIEDYIDNCCHNKIPTEEEQLERAEMLLDGEYPVNRLHDVIERLYVNR